MDFSKIHRTTFIFFPFHKHDKDGLNFSTYSRMDTFVENTVTKIPNQWLNISWVPSRSKDRHSWMKSSRNSRSKLFPSLLARKRFDSFWICKMKPGPKNGLPKLNISLRCDFLNGDSRRRCRCNRKPHFSGGSLQQNDIKRQFCQFEFTFKPPRASIQQTQPQRYTYQQNKRSHKNWSLKPWGISLTDSKNEGQKHSSCWTIGRSLLLCRCLQHQHYSWHS